MVEMNISEDIKELVKTKIMVEVNVFENVWEEFVKLATLIEEVSSKVWKDL